MDKFRVFTGLFQTYIKILAFLPEKVKFALNFIPIAGPPSPPPPPRASHVTCSSATLTWQPPAGNGGPVTLYTLHFQMAENPAQGSTYQPWMEQNTTATSLMINDLLPGRRYFVGVAAQNGVGAGAFSDVTGFTTDAIGKKCCNWVINNREMLA